MWETELKISSLKLAVVLADWSVSAGWRLRRVSSADGVFNRGTEGRVWSEDQCAEEEPAEERRMKLCHTLTLFFSSRSVTDPRDGKRVALKKMPNVFQNLVSCKRVFRELKMLSFFKHENVSSYEWFRSSL